MKKNVYFSCCPSSVSASRRERNGKEWHENHTFLDFVFFLIRGKSIQDGESAEAVWLEMSLGVRGSQRRFLFAYRFECVGFSFVVDYELVSSEIDGKDDGFANFHIVEVLGDVGEMELELVLLRIVFIAAFASSIFFFTRAVFLFAVGIGEGSVLLETVGFCGGIGDVFIIALPGAYNTGVGSCVLVVIIATCSEQRSEYCHEEQQGPFFEIFHLFLGTASCRAQLQTGLY